MRVFKIFLAVFAALALRLPVAMVITVALAVLITVRRHIIWNNLRPDLKEDLAHLVQDIRRRICGIASAGSPSFSV